MLGRVLIADGCNDGFVVLDLGGVAAWFGLRPIEILQEGSDRLVAQTEDDQGLRYTLKVAEGVDAFADDVAANGTLAAVGVPVPEVVAYQDGPPAVVVLGWVEGEPLSSSSSARAQREVGRLLRLIHALPAGPSFSGQPTIGGWIEAWTAEIAAWWSSVGGTGSQVRRLRDWFADLAPVLDSREGSLTLSDGRADHFLIRGDRVAGLIDLHDVGSGDGAMDLAVVGLADDRLIAAVRQGYDSDSDETTELNLLIPFYHLLRRLAGAEWHLRAGSRTERDRLLRLAGDSVQMST